MPRLGGHAATRAIRDVERRLGRAPVPIIALSANALPGDVEASLAAGCNAHLGKPFAKADLLRLLLAQRGEGGQPQRPPRPEMLDREAALARIGGDVDMYEQVLAAARAQWQDWPRRYQDSLADTDPLTPRRLVHDLKSTAATVGAQRLSAAAAALEAAWRDGSDPQPAQAAVAEALREVLDAG
jgi:CheY-like chemotaxis protein